MKSILKSVAMMLFGLSFGTSLSASAWAAEARKVILMTSFQSPKSVFHSNPDWAEAQVEKIFTEAFFQSGYQTEVIRSASAWQLYQGLHDPSVAGVFWLSHAAAPMQLNSVVSVSDAIVTYNGQDVKALFQDVGESVRFLAVIGCSDASTLTQYRKQGYYARNPQLQIVSFANKVDHISAFIYSLNQSIGNLGDARLSDYGPDSRAPNGDPDWMHDSIPTIRASSFQSFSGGDSLSSTSSVESHQDDLVVTRQVPTDADESSLSDLIFTSQGRFLGILPKPAPGEYQSVRMPHPSGRVLVSARTKTQKADFRGLKLQSSDGKTKFTPLSYQGHLIGADSALFLQ
jgi:hypothetical protein